MEKIIVIGKRERGLVDSSLKNIVKELLLSLYLLKDWYLLMRSVIAIVLK